MSDQKLSIVFFDAHAADMINSSAGTIANYARAGHHVSLVALTAGEKGVSFFQGTPRTVEEYRQAKIEMWQRCAQLLGVEDVRTLNWKDAELPHSPEVADACCDIIRQVRADIVVTHWKGTFHPDHLNTHRSVMDGVFLAGLPGYERAHPAHRVKQVFFTDNWEDWEDYTPDCYVDITAVMELKRQALDQFVQVKRNLGLSGGFDYKDFYEALARMRGCLSGQFRTAESYATAYKPAQKGSLLPA